MIKYNIMLCSLKNIDTSDLDILLDQYDIRLLDIETKGKFDQYSYIISEDNIIGFLTELPFEFFVKYIMDDTIYQINLLQKKSKKNCDIYRNRFHDRKPDYKLIYTDTENELYSICKYIEKNYN